MAITRAQQAKQMLQSGGEVLGPLGEDDLKNQLSPGTIGKGLAFVLSGGLTSGPALAKELAKQKILDEVLKTSGDIVRPRIETKLIQQDNRTQGIGGYQSDFAQDSDFMEGKGTSAEMGSFADGGNVVGGEFDFESARQMYGLGKLVKKVTRTVKKIAKSPVGKAAIAAATIKFGGPLAAKVFPSTFGTTASSPFLRAIGRGQFFTNQAGIPGIFRTAGEGLGILGRKVGSGKNVDFVRKGIFSNLGIGSAITGASLIAGALTPQEEEEAQQIADETGIDIQEIRANPNKYLARRFRAEGGSMKEPVAKKTMPLLDMGGKEMDLRAEGGFVPIGRMEKADDVPARLSKNEFVFTADAVRNAGDGNVDKGAEVMYNMMKNLEAGGDVSEESQGLEGARKMFKTSQRLEEVL